jgi:hypothetical protein
LQTVTIWCEKMPSSRNDRPLRLDFAIRMVATETRVTVSFPYYDCSVRPPLAVFS